MIVYKLKKSITKTKEQQLFTVWSGLMKYLENSKTGQDSVTAPPAGL